MLKRKLYNAGFLAGSFIFMSLVSVGKPSGKHQSPGSVITYNEIMHRADSSGEGYPDSITVKRVIEKAPGIILHKNVAGFVKDYIKKNGFFIGKSKARLAPYFSIMDSVLEENDLPVELKYLAYIESGLKYNAISWAGAVGPWAIMPVAAKEYGLKISKHRDERLDYYKSTRAAASLLADLYAKYGDWLLVIAAYNCGPGGVQKAIKRSGSRNYWSLQGFLPEETRKHVKKFIAVHYYFEGKGGLTTMTKAETTLYLKAMEAFEEKQQELQKGEAISAAGLK